eukprot:TRINITY_DN48439_c0_g1_i1.p1 TRINITY_DN48439_c0_g1~~TRINITY_DN48439_c0_g1_i1.p1  ORF type:complete len:240 (+),score=18.67 TRINITY_DN48439_c0_g1_i1:85-720(+)
MASTWAVPKSLHEVLGMYQTWTEVILVLLIGAGMTVIQYIALPPQAECFTSTLPPCRYWLGLMLAGDVYCGCLANFTRGTNDYYAHAPWMRWMFISMHWHLSLIGWLWFAGSEQLESSLPSIIAFNVLVLCLASVINILKASELQRFCGAVVVMPTLFSLLAVGAPLNLPAPVQPVAAMFLIKVAYAFAVDHYRASCRFGTDLPDDSYHAH